MVFALAPSTKIHKNFNFWFYPTHLPWEETRSPRQNSKQRMTFLFGCQQHQKKTEQHKIQFELCNVYLYSNLILMHCAAEAYVMFKWRADVLFSLQLRTTHGRKCFVCRPIFLSWICVAWQLFFQSRLAFSKSVTTFVPGLLLTLEDHSLFFNPKMHSALAKKIRCLRGAKKGLFPSHFQCHDLQTSTLAGHPTKCRRAIEFTCFREMEGYIDLSFIPKFWTERKQLSVNQCIGTPRTELVCSFCRDLTPPIPRTRAP